MADTTTAALTPEQLHAENARLQAQIAKMQSDQEKRTQKQAALKCKVGQKRGMAFNVSGQSYPVTLYRDQWEELIACLPEIKAFLLSHKEIINVADKEYTPKAK